jgi:hypothetical protein
MPYKVSWLVPGIVIHDRIWGELDAATVQKTSQIIADMLNENSSDPNLVHLLVDIRDATKLPRLMTEASKLSEDMPHVKHPRLGWSILVSNNIVARFLGSLSNHLSKTRFTAVSTPEEAVAFLRARTSAIIGDVEIVDDATLPEKEKAS